MSFVSNIFFTNLALCTTLKSNGNFLMDLTNLEGLERHESVHAMKSHLSCLAIYIYFGLNSAKVKMWKCDSGELFE